MTQFIVTHIDGNTLNLHSRAKGTYVESAKFRPRWQSYAELTLEIIAYEAPEWAYFDRIVVDDTPVFLHEWNEAQHVDNKGTKYILHFYGIEKMLFEASPFLDIDGEGAYISKDKPPIVGNLELFGNVLCNCINYRAYNTATGQRYKQDTIKLGTCPAETKHLLVSTTEYNAFAALLAVCSAFKTHYTITTNPAGDTDYLLNFGVAPGVYAPLAYGRGKGLYRLDRKSISSENVKTILTVLGSSKNLPQGYGKQRLELDETLYPGSIIADNDKIQTFGAWNDVYIAEDIMPEYRGEILGVDIVDKFAFYCELDDFDPTGGTLNMLTGNLAGSNFRIAAFNAASGKVTVEELVDSSGFAVPSVAPYLFATGDTFTIVDIPMPQAYIEIAQQALAEAGQARYLEISQPRVAYNVALHSRFVKNYGSRPKVGMYFPITDARYGVNKAIQCVTLERNLLAQDEYEYTNCEVADNVVETLGAKIYKQSKEAQALLKHLGATHLTTPTSSLQGAARTAQAAAVAAAEAVAALEAEAARVAAEAYADGILSAEEAARIADVAAKLTEAKQYAAAQAAAAESAAKTYAEGQAAAAQAAAEAVAAAEAEAAELAANAYADGIVTAEEQRAIAEAAAKLTEAKNYAESQAASAETAASTYAAAQAEAARLAAIASAKTYTDTEVTAAKGYADSTAAAAQSAAEAYALAKANLAETNAEAYADGIVDAEEAARIAEATAKLNEAKTYAETKASEAQTAAQNYAATAASNAQSAAQTYALEKANLAETTAKAYADGVVSDEEARAIADATAKMNEAKAHAETKATEAKNAAEAAAALDATAKANAAKSAAESYALAKANLAETTAKAYADGIVDAEEARAIADATAKANAAKAAAEATAAALDAAIQIGGRNLIINSSFQDLVTGNPFTVDGITYNTYARYIDAYNGGISNPTTSYHAHIDTDTFGFNVCEYNESNGSRNWKAFFSSVATQLALKTGTFVFSADLYATGVGTRVYGGFYYKNTAGTVNFHGKQYFLYPAETNRWVRLSDTCTILDDIDWAYPVVFYMYGFGFSTNSVLYMRRPKLEIGNKATDWTPAPEDVQEDYATKFGYSSYSDLVAQAAEGKTIMEGGYLRNSLIDTEHLIAHDAFINRIATNSLTIGKITDTAAALDDAIQVGGRNLLRNSGVTVQNSSYPINNYGLTKAIPEGTQVTVTIEGVLAPEKDSFMLYNSGGSIQITFVHHSDEVSAGVYRKTFNWIVGASANTYLNIYPKSYYVVATSTINRIKLEVGNKATDWTPAPEDVDADIAAAQQYAATAASNAQSAAESYALAKANLAETTAKAYADGIVTDAEADAIAAAAADATAKANAAKAAAEAAAKAYTDTGLGTKQNADERIDNIISTSGLPYRADLVIYGESNKYYPVYIFGGNQDLIRTIKIWRVYYEQAPDDWYSSTHKGSLTLTWKGNFGGWGGAVYRHTIEELACQYTELMAYCQHACHYMAYCFHLRGGGATGAIYHFASDQPFGTPWTGGTAPAVYYNGASDVVFPHDEIAYRVTAFEPLTSVNSTHLNSIKLAKQESVDAAASAAASDATTKMNAAKDAIAQEAGYTNFADMASKAALTVNGLLNSNIINTDQIFADKLLAFSAFIDNLTVRKLLTPIDSLNARVEIKEPTTADPYARITIWGADASIWSTYARMFVESAADSGQNSPSAALEVRTVYMTAHRKWARVTADGFVSLLDVGLDNPATNSKHSGTHNYDGMQVEYKPSGGVYTVKIKLMYNSTTNTIEFVLDGLPTSNPGGSVTVWKDSKGFLRIGAAVAYTAADVGAVPTTRKVNNKALSADISLTAADVGAVPTSLKVNSKALSADITLSAADVGALPSNTIQYYTQAQWNALTQAQKDAVPLALVQE